jgi:tellurite methyltransferase
MKYIKENYIRFFGQTPDKSSYGYPMTIVTKIVDLLPTGSSVLDLGSGDGRHALYLAEHGFRVKAVDASEAGLEKLARFATAKELSIETQVVDLTTWSIDTEYDAMIATVIFQHLHTEPALRLIAEMKAKTKPGGIHAITLFTKQGDRYLLDREEDPGAFYPDNDWLRDYYTDWEIIESGAVTGPLIGKYNPDGTPMLSTIEKLLARKS